MAIVTGDLYKGFTFGDISSKAYGVYITQEAAYNAPERDVSVYEIAGRNGAYVLDNGRFRNITVTYKCGIALDSETDFEAAIRVFRNALASQAGKYVRLTDEYNPNEFRQAAFLGGIEVEMADRRAGEFAVSFDCKPQRFLISGETPVEVVGGEPRNPRTYSGAVATFEGTETDIISSLKVTITPKQSGSGDPSPSNVRPITGTSTANVTVAGKNIFDVAGWISTFASGQQVTFQNDVMDVGSTAGNLYSKPFQFAEHDTQVTISIASATLKTGASNIRIELLNESGSAVGSLSLGNDTQITRTASKLRFNYSSLGSGFTVTKPQIELGASVTEYEPYNGHTTPVPLGQTVYGGEVDVVSGVMTIDKGVTTFNGSETWLEYDYNGVKSFRTPVATMQSGASLPVICDKFAFTAYPWAQVDGYHVGDSAQYIYFQSQDITTVSAWEAWLGSNNTTVVYPLATTTTVQLTPTQVASLLGTNNVWSDAGSVEVTVADNPNMVVNPTLFEARPLLQVWGYGDIGVNGETISVSDVPIGRVILANAEQTEGGRTYYTGNRYTFTIDPAALDTGDDIYGTYMDGNRHIGMGLTYTIYALTAPGYGPLTGTVARISEHAFDFEYGTADTFTIVNNNQQYEILRLSDVQTITGVLKYRIEVAYDGDRTITVTPYYTGTTFTEGIQQQGILFGLGHDTVYGDSTVSALGTPLLIDLDIGEAYKEENGEIISSNAGVSLPAELPVLRPGANTITFDNTVTELDIVPRWWEV